MTLEAIKKEVRALPMEEQTALAADILEQLYHAPREHDLASECEAIIDAVDRGEMTTADGPAFFARLRQELAQ